MNNDELSDAMRKALVMASAEGIGDDRNIVLLVGGTEIIGGWGYFGKGGEE